MDTKFKVGDLIKSKWSKSSFKIIKIAEKDEKVEGDWCDRVKYKILPERVYILEAINNKKLYYGAVGMEENYELIGEAPESKQDPKNPFPTLKEFLGEF